MMLVVIYSLFGNDIKLGFMDKKSDEFFDWMTTIALMLFTFEIIAMSLVNEGFFLGFYFWLDVMSTVSMITDISVLWNSLTGTGDDYTATTA